MLPRRPPSSPFLGFAAVLLQPLASVSTYGSILLHCGGLVVAAFAPEGSLIRLARSFIFIVLLVGLKKSL